MTAADVLLVLRAQQGEREALDGVLRQVQGPLFRFIRSDRKSTRLNSSHLVISYAVFCLKKKKIEAHVRYYRRPDRTAVPLPPRRPVAPLQRRFPLDVRSVVESASGRFPCHPGLCASER